MKYLILILILSFTGCALITTYERDCKDLCKTGKVKICKEDDKECVCE